MTTLGTNAITDPESGGEAKKHEIYTAASGRNHLLIYFNRASGGGHGPLVPSGPNTTTKMWRKVVEKVVEQSKSST